MTSSSAPDDEVVDFSLLQAGEYFRFAASWMGEYLWLKTDNSNLNAVCVSDGELVELADDERVVPLAVKLVPIGE